MVQTDSAWKFESIGEDDISNRFPNVQDNHRFFEKMLPLLVNNIVKRFFTNIKPGKELV